MSKHPSLMPLIQKMQKAGFDVYTIKGEEPTTFFKYTKDDKIGYIQSEGFGTIRVSTVHKPRRENGTGFYFGETNIENPDFDMIERALTGRPNWARGTVTKYSSVEEWLKACPILQYRKLREIEC